MSLFPPHLDHALAFVQMIILVDAFGRARVAGPGVAFDQSPTPGVDVDRSFYGAAPELFDPQHFGLTDTGATKESDVYAFGVLVWEGFRSASTVPRRGGGIPGVYSVLSGRRPPHPNHAELSDRTVGPGVINDR